MFPLNRMVGREFVPNEDMGEWIVHLDAPEGTSLEGSTRSRVQASQGRQRYRRRGAHRAVHRRAGGSGAPTHIHLLCQALPIGDRKNTQAEIIDEMRRRLAAFPGYRPSITSRNALGSGEGTGRLCDLREYPRTGSPADCRVFDARARRGAEDPSLTDVKINLSLSNPEVHVAVDRKRAADLGVRMATVGNTLRLAVSGDDQISFYKEAAGAVSGQDARARGTAARYRGNRPADGAVGVGPGAHRQHRAARARARADDAAASNRQFTVMLIADVAQGHALDEAANDVRRMLADLKMPPTMSYRLQGQSRILDETTANLIMAIGLAMIFVYMVLASQFESFLQPIVIMLALPIAVPFALFTLWATGRTLNLWSALGMLLLLGIVKKNSILQVDYANVLRARGLPIREAIVESCRTRLRPILMTTAAIIAGLIPTSLGIGIGGTGRAAIAVTIIGGQSLCLLLTLLLVPVAYVKFDALERAFVGEGRRRGSARVSAATFGRFRPATNE